MVIIVSRRSLIRLSCQSSITRRLPNAQLNHRDQKWVLRLTLTSRSRLLACLLAACSLAHSLVNVLRVLFLSACGLPCPARPALPSGSSCISGSNEPVAAMRALGAAESKTAVCARWLAVDHTPDPSWLRRLFSIHDGKC